MAGFTVDQLVVPATPRSLPIHLTSGPASENITASGCSLRTRLKTRGQSYSWRLPFGPSPLAPIEPHLVNCAVLREQLGELIAIHIVVARRVAVGRWLRSHGEQ